MLNFNSTINHIVPIINTKNISEREDMCSGLKWLNPEKYSLNFIVSDFSVSTQNCVFCLSI